MRLSKTEQIALLVFILAVILGVGIFMFVYPAFSNIGINQKSLDSKEAQRDEIYATLAREDTIDDEIKASYEAGKEVSEYFYPDLTNMDADDIIRGYLEELGIDNQGLSFSGFSTQPLSLQFYEEVEVTYPLKEYSRIDMNAIMGIQPEAAEEAEADPNVFEDAAAEENAKKKKYTPDEMRELLSGSQTVGGMVVDFSVTCTIGKYKELMDFIYNLKQATYLPSAVVPYTAGDGGEPAKDTDEVEAAISLILYCVQPMDEPTFVDDKAA